MLKDLFVFGIHLVLIACFLFFLKKYFGIELQPKKFIQELRKLLSLTPSPETINALGLVLLALLSVLVLLATLTQGLRAFVYVLLGSNPEAIPSIPFFTMFGFLLGIFFLAIVCSQVYCDRHTRFLLELERLRQGERGRRGR